MRLIGTVLVGAVALAATNANAQICRSGLDSYWGCANAGYYSYAVPVSPYAGSTITIIITPNYAVSPYSGGSYYSDYR